MANEFNCNACGAPVTPEPGLQRMTCPYCHTQLTLPDNLQRKAPPPAVEMRVEPPQLSPPETQQQVTDFIRRVQPAAIKGWNLFAQWTRLKRLIPGCIIALIGLCLLGCIMLGIIFSFIQRG